MNICSYITYWSWFWNDLCVLIQYEYRGKIVKFLQKKECNLLVTIQPRNIYFQYFSGYASNRTAKHACVREINMYTPYSSKGLGCYLFVQMNKKKVRIITFRTSSWMIIVALSVSPSLSEAITMSWNCLPSDLSKGRLNVSSPLRRSSWKCRCGVLPDTIL